MGWETDEMSMNRFLNLHWYLDKFGMTGSTFQLINGAFLLSVSPSLLTCEKLTREPLVQSGVHWRTAHLGHVPELRGHLPLVWTQGRGQDWESEIRLRRHQSHARTFSFPRSHSSSRKMIMMRMLWLERVELLLVQIYGPRTPKTVRLPSFPLPCTLEL